MALTYRNYRCAMVSLSLTSIPGLWPAVAAYVRDVKATGENYWTWIHDARPARYVLAYCDSAVHAQIAADVNCTVLSAELADLAAVEAWMDGLASAAPQAVRDQLEADGCPIDWATAQTTKRQVWNYLIRLHTLTQELRRLKDPDSLDFFSRALSATVGGLPAATRTKVQTWMNNRGLDTSWITGPTTVRQVVRYVLENATFPVLRLGPVAV